MPYASSHSYDAVIVGSGPNGLAAAITLAQAGRSVLVLEAQATFGGGTRTLELTLPGFQHDLCSAIHPLGLASPFFRDLSLSEWGLEWIEPPVALAHPLDGGRAVALLHSLEDTCARLGPDGPRYRALFAPLVEHWQALLEDVLGPLPLPPRHPLLLARFGLGALLPAATLARRFQTLEAQALFAGLAAHSILPLERPGSAAFGLVLGLLAHAVGWPLARRGSGSISQAMLKYLHSLGGELHTGQPVTRLADLPPARQILFDLTPRQILAIAGERLPPAYQHKLRRYRYGPGSFKLDWALSQPIPWAAAECRQAGTVHLGGTLPEIALSERQAWQGRAPEQPFVLLAQPSLFDPARAPHGMHTAWAYCHVPHGSGEDMTARIEAQIERFAPGFRDCILQRAVHSPAQMQALNANYIGGDINGGVQDLFQLWSRPVLSRSPYRLPVSGLYICSSSTPPGGGVHGMCGYHAARAVLVDDGRP